VDPLSADGQFCDRGPTYVSAIFYHDDEQRRLAEESKQRLDGRFAQPIVTGIRPAAAFYPAEAYHQDYYRKNPIRYKFYRSRCGRDARLAALWGPAAH
jgi:peptide-methionine (S)-S-oxide reductase